MNGPFTPDLSTPLPQFGTFIQEQGWKDEFSAALIGSCTNSSYEDMVGNSFDVPFSCAQMLFRTDQSRGSRTTG